MKHALLTALKNSWILICAICYATGLLIGSDKVKPTTTPPTKQTIREFAESFPNVTKANLLIVSAAHEAGIDHEMELLQTVIPFAIRKNAELNGKIGMFEKEKAQLEMDKMKSKINL